MLLKTVKRLVPLVNRAIAEEYTVSMAYGMVWHILACLMQGRCECKKEWKRSALAQGQQYTSKFC